MGLAKRVIPTLLLDHGNLVKGRQFQGWRVVGNPLVATKVFNLREADELVVFDVSASREGRPPDFDTIRKISSVNFVPLTVGGGIRSVEDAKRLIRECGADKVAFGSGALGVPSLIRDTANYCGRQAVVAVFTSGRSSWEALEAVARDLGEVIVQSLERDGCMDGYDLSLISRFAFFDVPVVASSGCGAYDHMAAALDSGADAVAAGSIWQFTSATPKEAKQYLGGKGWEVRL